MTQRRLPHLPGPVRVVIALGAVLLALVLTRALGDWLSATQMALFTGAVLAGGLLGTVAGLVAIAASLVAAELFILGDGYAAAGHLVGWLVIAIIVVIALDRMRAARRAEQQRTLEARRLSEQLEEKARDLEAEVTESESMAQELEELNQQLTEQADIAQRAAARAQRLQRFTAMMHDRVGASGVARHIVEEGRRALEAIGGAVVALRDDGSLEVLAAHGYPQESLDRDAPVYAGPTPLADVIRSGEPMWIADERELLEKYPSMAEQPRIGAAWAALPLQIEKRRTGALVLSFDKPGAFVPEDRAFMELVAQQCAHALERARLHEMELEARVRAEFAERRLAFIAEASERLSASLDYLASLANLAYIAVPEIADWCVVHLTDDDGVLRLVAAVHSDAKLAATRRELEEKYPPLARDDAAYAQALRTGEVVHIEPVTDAYLESYARDEEHLAALRGFGLRALISIPIMVEDRPKGVLTLGSAESGRTFGENDITLALELGRRAGNAVENARLYQAAHHASEAKSDFLAVMSHELRTPLNAIIGYSDLLLMGVPDGVPENARRQIQRIRIASTSLLHLVEEVLSFSRVEAGKEEIRISPVDVAPLVRECLTMIEPLAAEKSLDVSLEEPVDRVKVVSDERKIRQILTNLLSNAVKFTEKGSITVTMEETAGSVLIRVTDTGIGIPVEHLDRIFEPFWQVEQSATRRFGGTGLGLGVARKLAKLLEGRLEVESSVGEGSTFTLILPRHTPGLHRPSSA